MAFSSDSPLTPCNPLHAIKTAVTREVEGGVRLSEGEGVTIVQAIEMYSCAGAYSSYDERAKGSLSGGQLADLVILESNGRFETIRVKFLDG